jgi:uncharacterized protein
MQRSIELESEGTVLRGMFHLPENAGPRTPLLVIFHGFTGTKVENHFLYVKLSRHLESRGIASLRYDFSGSGESDGDFGNMTLSGEIRDAKRIYESALSLPHVDPDSVFILGHSMGGVVASIVAAEAERKPRGLVLVAPAGNMIPIAEAKLRENADRTTGNGGTDIGGLIIGRDFLPDLRSIDLAGRAAGYRGSACVIQGSVDPVVPEAVSRAYYDVYPGRKRYVLIEGAGHNFDSRRLEETLFSAIVGFIVDEEDARC